MYYMYVSKWINESWCLQGVFPAHFYLYKPILNARDHMNNTPLAHLNRNNFNLIMTLVVALNHFKVHKENNSQNRKVSFGR